MRFPKLQLMIDHLKSLDNSPSSECGFDMNVAHRERGCSEHPCGTACCIGGWAALLLIKQGAIPNETHNIIESLVRYCDIPWGVADFICWPSNAGNKFAYEGTYTDISLEHAIAVLERCRDIGIVDWTPTMESMLEEISDTFLEMKEEARDEI